MYRKLPFQAIILAGGEGDQIFPLTSADFPKALLPVANLPLITYALRRLKHAGVTNTIVVTQGEAAAKAIGAYVTNWGEANGMTCELVPVGVDCASAEALRTLQAAGKLTGERLMVMTGDVATDICLRTLVAAHFLNTATMTAVLYTRKTLASTETKIGKAPKKVDYVAMDSTKSRLLFYTSSPEALRDIKVPLALIKKWGPFEVSTKYINSHIYIFDTKPVLEMLADKPKLQNIQNDLVPYMLKLQLSTASAQSTESSHDPLASRLLAAELGSVEPPAMSENVVPSLSHVEARQESGQATCCVYLVEPEVLCARASSLQAYSELNRDAAAALQEGSVTKSVVLGSKANVGPGCMVGEGTEIGEKGSVKRSVVGKGCSLGAGVKIINSVVMDGVEVGEGSTIQNSIICQGCRIGADVMLKDCQIGADYNVTDGQDLKGDVLSNTAKTEHA